MSLAEVKAQVRLDHAYEDEYLQRLIQTATTFVEDYIGRSLLEQTWRVIRREEGGVGEVSLPYPPVLEILSVNTTLSGNKKKQLKGYHVTTNHQIPRLVMSDFYDALEVEYVAGFGKNPGDVPGPLRQAILMVVADWYENRGIEIVPVNNTVEVLLRPYKVMGLG